MNDRTIEQNTASDTQGIAELDRIESTCEQLNRRVWMAGLWPAFRDTRTGETHLATNSDGVCAVQHSFHGLPDHWVTERDADGFAICLHPSVQAGYWRSPDFFALDAQLSLPIDG